MALSTERKDPVITPSNDHQLYVGLDDTDTPESRGTGHLARRLAAALEADYAVQGVTRHQLLIDPRVPYTAKNSSAAIILGANGQLDLQALKARVHDVVDDLYHPGSDPGICIAHHVPSDISRYGRRVQQKLVSQEEARALAAAHGLKLMGLAGTEQGVIGALAAVGLAAAGDDGRYVMVGRSRDLSGLRPVSAVLEAGIAEVRTTDGREVTDGLLLTDKLRPARRRGRPVAVVHWAEGYWQPLKLD